jgi:putative redox protein
LVKATATWVDGQQFVARSGSGHELVLDSSVAAGGQNGGPSPMELILMGVLGCTGMDVISILQKKRQPVQRLKVFATGEQAKEYPRPFQKIHLEYVAYGDVDPVALERSIQLSEEKYCSAIATLRGQVEFTRSYRVEPVVAEGDPAEQAGVR